jgi:hypothetical protein
VSLNPIQDVLSSDIGGIGDFPNDKVGEADKGKDSLPFAKPKILISLHLYPGAFGFISDCQEIGFNILSSVIPTPFPDWQMTKGTRLESASGAVAKEYGWPGVSQPCKARSRHQKERVSYISR